MAPHSQECIDAAARAEIARNQYRAQWPDVCVVCEGWGGADTYYDPSPAGVSLGGGTIQEFDTCPFCIDQDCCPRCFCPVTADAEDYMNCADCGWTSKAPEGMPQPYDGCNCFKTEEFPDLFPV